MNSKKIEENEKRRILEEENEYIKKKLETISEKNKYIANKLNESEFQKKELETKYQLEIIELKKKISFLVSSILFIFIEKDFFILLLYLIISSDFFFNKL